MKNWITPMIAAAAFVVVPVAQAQRGTLKPAPPKPEPKPVPLFQADEPEASPPARHYEQKQYGTHSPLVTSEQAEAVIAKFKEAYPRLGSPRFVIYVNRELVDEESGLQLTSRTERTVEKTTTKSGPGNQAGDEETSTVVRGENRMRVKDRAGRTLSDRQTIRDVERLFGRPFRSGGASLADQTVATQVLQGRSLVGAGSASEGGQARKDREALSNIADVAVEVLISSRDVVVTEVSGSRTYSVPDIQATAIRLEDAKIIGQASSADLVGEGSAAGRAARQHSVQEITQATALALMEDMVQDLP